ncbi:MAG TPA: cation-translocating P-type ATPase [Microbacteriaceae bacterium]|nr:cation-translocating P-type ATPase [Microbacteriaceae bacterium]
MTDRVTELNISGMTCSSCVAHVSRRLETIPGVSASVNLATERAVVSAPSSVSGEQIIAAVRAAGYDASLRTGSAAPSEHQHGADGHGRQAGGSLLERLWVAGVLTAPVLAISMVPAWQFDYWQFLVFVLATPVVWWAGWPFHRSAAVGLKTGRFSMDTLVSVGTLTAWGWSTWAIMFGHASMIGMRHEWSLLPSGTDPTANLYFETAAVLIFVILLGRWLEERSRRDAGAALRALAALLPARVRLVEGDRERMVSREEVRPDQILSVRPGETIPIDGFVEQGSGALTVAMLTGESDPVPVAPGSAVLAGALALDGRLIIRASRVGADTRIAQLTALVDAAQVAKSSIQRLADRISAVFVPVVLGLAVATGLVWWLVAANPGRALSVAIAVVIIACPCALGLATPVAILAGTGRGAQLGIIISGPDAIERARRIRTVVLDKTGTLTRGEVKLAELHVSGLNESEALALLAGLERGSAHPIARAVEAAASERGVAPESIDALVEEPGTGIHGVVSGRSVRALAAHRWAGPLPRNWPETSALTSVLLVRDEQPIALALFSDAIRPDAALAIRQLVSSDITPVLLSGDRLAATRAVADELGIHEVFAEHSPEQKAAFVRERRTHGPIAMVGDGVNDAAALAEADLGIAMGRGADLARAASDITLLRDDAVAIPQALRLAQATRRVILGNLFWAFGYNVAAIPLAMAGLLGPMIAGAAMAFSSVFVVLNSVRLTRFR